MIRVFDGRLRQRPLPWWRWPELLLAVAVIFAIRASRLMSDGAIPASRGRYVVFVAWASDGARQTAEETVPGVGLETFVCSGDFRDVFCTLGTDRSRVAPR